MGTPAAAAPLAADFGGTAAATSAPLAAATSTAVPNPAMGFTGATGFPATGDVLTAAAPSILPSADALAAGAMPTPAGADPFATGSWGGTGGGLIAGLPYGAADPNAAAAPPPAAAPNASGLIYDPTTDTYTMAAGAPISGAGTAGAVPGAAPAAAAQPSWFDSATKTLQSVESSPWTRLGLAAAPLAIGLSGMHQSLPASAQQAQANYAALAAQGANLNAPQQAVLAQMRQNLTNQWKQTLFNQGAMAGKGGVPLTTQWPQIAAYIDQQVAASAQQMIQQNIQNALQGNAGLVQLANLQMQEDRNFQNTLQNATRALGLAAGLGGVSKTVTTTTTGAPTT